MQTDFSPLEQAVKIWMDELYNFEPMIEPELKRNLNRQWVLTLIEVWPEDTIDRFSTSQALDKRVEWCETELKKWPGVKRMAWDQWWFDDKVPVSYTHLPSPRD